MSLPWWKTEERDWSMPKNPSQGR